MRRVLKLALATAAIGLAAAATPAEAAVVVVGGEMGVPSCSAWSFSQNETACAGGYENNQIGSSPVDSTSLAALQALGYTGDGSFTAANTIPSLAGSSTLNFNQMMYGLTIIGLHYGAAGAKPEATSFFAFDLGTTGASEIDITGRAGANSLGTSNAVLFQTDVRGVPEPATWGMMLLGFAGMGMVLRRSKRRTNALMQVA